MIIFLNLFFPFHPKIDLIKNWKSKRNKDDNESINKIKVGNKVKEK